MITRGLFALAFALFLAALISGKPKPKTVVLPAPKVNAAPVIEIRPRPAKHADPCNPPDYLNGRKLLGMRMVSFAAGMAPGFDARRFCRVSESTLTVTGAVPVYEGDE